jgi:hypothetical protein
MATLPKSPPVTPSPPGGHPDPASIRSPTITRAGMVAHGRRAFEGPRSHLSLVTKDYERSANVRVLDPEDVAESVLYALRQPEHAAVNEVLVQPRDEPV